MLTLTRRETTFGLVRKSSFVGKRRSCTNQQQRKTVSHPFPPTHSTDMHAHVDMTANLMWLGTGRGRLNSAAVASRTHTREFKGRRSDICLVAQCITRAWLHRSKITVDHLACPLFLRTCNERQLKIWSDIVSEVHSNRQGKLTVANFNTLRTGDADLRFYITTVQDGWRKSAFLTRFCFPCTIHLIMQYIEPVSEWSCWWMFIETWPHSELTFRHRASSI